MLQSPQHGLRGSTHPCHFAKSDASLPPRQVFIGPMSAVFNTKDENVLFLVDSDPESPELGGSIRQLDVRSGEVTTILPATRGHKDGKDE